MSNSALERGESLSLGIKLVPTKPISAAGRSSSSSAAVDALLSSGGAPLKPEGPSKPKFSAGLSGARTMSSVSGSFSRALFAMSCPEVPKLNVASAKAKGPAGDLHPTKSAPLRTDSSAATTPVHTPRKAESTRAAADPVATPPAPCPVQEAPTPGAPRKATRPSWRAGLEPVPFPLCTEPDDTEPRRSIPTPRTPDAPMKPHRPSWRADLEPIPCALQRFNEEDEDTAGPLSASVPTPQTPDAPIKPYRASWRSELEPVPCALQSLNDDPMSAISSGQTV